MADISMDLSRARPELINPTVLARAEHIITMGSDVEGVPRVMVIGFFPIRKASFRNACARFAISFVRRPAISPKNWCGWSRKGTCLETCKTRRVDQSSQYNFALP